MVGYVIFVPGQGWFKAQYYDGRSKEYQFTQNRNEAKVWRTFSGAKRMALKIPGAHVEEL